jgi:hypothetical protein
MLEKVFVVHASEAKAPIDPAQLRGAESAALPG